MDRTSFSRRFRSLALATLLLAIPAQTGQHFSYPISVFSYKLHPSVPLEDFVAGDLGIVLPTYARSYLYTAYRWMEGAPMSPEEQEAVVAYWQEKLRIEAPPPEDGWDKWYDLRDSLDIPLADGAPYEQVAVRYMDTRDFIQYMQCGVHGHEVATHRLQEHIERFGPESAEVREWVQAQDLVFSNCDYSRDVRTIPPAAPAGTHPAIRRDRLYQIAAAWFISARFDRAEQAFRRIEPDPTWPGGLWAPYMIGRSLLWQARTELDDAKHAVLQRRAQVQFENVLRDDRLAPTHDAARYLLIRILTVTDPEAGARLLGLRLISPLRASSRKQDLRQYLTLLDAALGRGWSPGSLDDPQSLGRRDHLTDWIVSFKSDTQVAAAHTLDRWRQTGATAWLLAALQKARPGQPAVAELLKAAAQVGQGPGWAGAQFYRAKLLAELGDHPQARQVLDELIPVLADRLSSLNRALGLRARVAVSFEEALRYGIRLPTSFGSMTSHGEERTPWFWDAWEERQYGSLSRRPMVTPDLADVLNTAVPLDELRRLVISPSDIPKQLRRELVLSAWVRAVLLEEWPLARQLASDTAKLVPETAPSMEQFRSADATSRPLVAKLILLRFPGIGVEVRSGIGRNAPLSRIQLDGLNWWWWKDAYGVDFGRATPVAVDWVTSADQAKAKLEWGRIVGLGEGHDWLYQGVLDECGQPDPPALCAEALYRVAVSFKAIGYWHDPAWLDLDLGYLDTSVPPMMHRVFPRSVWTRHINADLEALRQPWRDADGNYHNVVPYPR